MVRNHIHAQPRNALIAKFPAATKQEILTSLRKGTAEGGFRGNDLCEVIREGVKLQELQCASLL